jgi:hypothetical protein
MIDLCTYEYFSITVKNYHQDISGDVARIYQILVMTLRNSNSKAASEGLRMCTKHRRKRLAWS